MQHDGHTMDASAAKRRAFLKKAATVAVTAPAVSLLLSAQSKPASAGLVYAIDTSTPG
jgi:hypothetical protein